VGSIWTINKGLLSKPDQGAKLALAHCDRTLNVGSPRRTPHEMKPVIMNLLLYTSGAEPNSK
jgi:hypothetical protein